MSWSDFRSVCQRSVLWLRLPKFSCNFGWSRSCHPPHPTPSPRHPSRPQTTLSVALGLAEVRMRSCLPSSRKTISFRSRPHSPACSQRNRNSLVQRGCGAGMKGGNSRLARFPISFGGALGPRSLTWCSFFFPFFPPNPKQKD